VNRQQEIRSLVRNGLYYLTEHADEEAMNDGIDIYDIEYCLLSGTIQQSWPDEAKYEIVGVSIDGRAIGVVCRITSGSKVRIITVYEIG
jgi:hypothetical protein